MRHASHIAQDIKNTGHLQCGVFLLSHHHTPWHACPEDMHVEGRPCDQRIAHGTCPPVPALTQLSRARTDELWKMFTHIGIPRLLILYASSLPRCGSYFWEKASSSTKYHRVKYKFQWLPLFSTRRQRSNWALEWWIMLMIIFMVDWTQYRCMRCISYLIGIPPIILKSDFRSL